MARATEGDRARLFVALDLAAAVRRELRAWAGAVVGRREGLRLVAEESLHVTLCFLGSRPVDEIGEVVAACRPVAGCGEVRLALGEPMWLPRRRPSVLSVALVDLDGGLAHVQSTLAGALVAAGVFEAEARRFLPHVTLARVRRGARLRAEPLEAPAALDFIGATVTLYRSHTGPGGSRYEPLASQELGGGG